jgi:hypothetical protein
MKAFLTAYQKQLEVAFLLLVLVGMDLAQIKDAELKYVLMGLVGSLTGFRGIQSLIGIGNGQSAASAQPSQPTPPAQ